MYLQHESMTTAPTPPSMMATFHHVTEGSHHVTVCYRVLWRVLQCVYLQHESMTTAPTPPSTMATFHHVTEGSHHVTV